MFETLISLAVCILLIPATVLNTAYVDLSHYTAVSVILFLSIFFLCLHLLDVIIFNIFKLLALYILPSFLILYVLLFLDKYFEETSVGA
jgi:hypothetical protein